MRPPEAILAGDIGGTKTVLALFSRSGGGLAMLREEVFPSRDAKRFDAILARFLEGLAPEERVGGACFGVAGPVGDGVVETTNLPWTLVESQLSRTLGGRSVRLINDLQAAAYGMLFLAPNEYEVLNLGEPPPRPGNIAVLSPGTGLGEALLYWNGSRYEPLASEGGHASFAPGNDRQMELLRYMRARVGGHVSYERILSGDGFGAVYDFLRDSGFASESEAAARQLGEGDRNAAITRLGLAKADLLCSETLRTFASILGAEAGNLALKGLTTSGVLIGGGIPPKILPGLKGREFLDAFVDKGRFEEWLGRLSVKVALNPRAPLIGAAHYFVDAV